jgi:hypothetical protein
MKGRPPSPALIQARLTRLRWLRYLSYGPMAAFAFLVLVESLAAPPLSESANQAANLILPFAFAGFALSFWMRSHRCPRCGLPFFQSRRRLPGGALFPVWNDFTSKCLNCGLPIDGS